MGRAPCCDKTNVKKGPWSPEEDAKLKSYIEEHGTGGNWIALPQKIGLRRCGKSCRLRWLNYLRPNIKHGGFSEEEENIICNLYLSIGSRWSIIAAQLPGRTDNDIKNYWNTKLKKKLLGKQRKEQARQTISCSKQEMTMKKDSESFVVSEGIMNPNPIPYWPDLPVQLSAENLSQEAELKDQASIRKLLVSLGGRFLDDHHQQPNLINATTNLQYPSDISATKDQLPYGNSINTFASSASLNSTDVDCCQLPNTPNYDSVNGGPNMYQEFNHHQIVELGDHQMVYNTPQQLDGLESISGLDMVNCSCGTSSAESTSWVDHINSLLSSPMISIFEASQKGSTFEESRYFGLQ